MVTVYTKTSVFRQWLKGRKFFAVALSHSSHVADGIHKLVIPKQVRPEGGSSLVVQSLQPPRIYGRGLARKRCRCQGGLAVAPAASTRTLRVTSAVVRPAPVCPASS